jgi:acyl-CoA synthetase (AMP-forming)/AMP-acid ligase II
MSTNTASELMTINAARLLRDGDVVFVGVGLPNLACNLAHRTHTPNLMMIYEAGVIGARPAVFAHNLETVPRLSRQVRVQASYPRSYAVLAHARKRLGPAVAPREIAVLPSLPRTRSGKIMRRILKEIAAGGQVRGDTTTLEDFGVISALQSEE